jgi:hypothetical protein
VGSFGYRIATAACDKRGSRSRTLVMLALLAVLVSTSMAAPSPAQPPPGMAEVFIDVAAMPFGAVQLDPPGFFNGSAFSLCRHTEASGECHVAYLIPEGTTQSVTLTPVPDPTSNPHQTFLRWSTPQCGTAPTCTFVLTPGAEPPEIYALFTPAQFRVIIHGSGRVTGANGAIDCLGPEPPTPPTPKPGCSASTFPAGTPLTLTANPPSGIAVTWVYGCDPGDDPHALTCALVPENRMVGVRFGDGDGLPGQPFNVGISLRVTKSGTGTGTVSGGPTSSGGGQIECGSTCVTNPSVGFGVRVKLTAAASSGSRFVRWLGAPCSTANTCVLNAGPVTTVGAVFDTDAPAPPPPGTTTTTTTTASTPPTTRPQAPTRLSVRFLGASSKRVKGRYRVFARVELSKPARARLSVLRGKRLLGERVLQMRKGRTTAWVALNPTTRKGACQVRMRVRDGSGQLVIIQRRIVLGR